MFKALSRTSMIRWHRRHRCWPWRNIRLGWMMVLIRRRLVRYVRFVRIFRLSEKYLRLLYLGWSIRSPDSGLSEPRENYLEELNPALSWLNVSIWSFKTGGSSHGTFHDWTIVSDNIFHAVLNIVWYSKGDSSDEKWKFHFWKYDFQKLKTVWIIFLRNRYKIHMEGDAKWSHCIISKLPRSIISCISSSNQRNEILDACTKHRLFDIVQNNVAAVLHKCLRSRDWGHILLER